MAYQYTLVTGLSGAFNVKIASTGQQAWLAAQNNGTNLSGSLASTGQSSVAYTDLRVAATGLAGVNYTDVRVAATGAAADSYADTRVAATGQAAVIYTDTRVAATGQQAWLAATHNPTTVYTTGTQTITGPKTFFSVISQVSGSPIPLIATDTGNYTINLTTAPNLLTITITGATLFDASNYIVGGGVAVRVNVSGENAVPVRFPVEWNWVSSTPTGLNAGRFAILTLNTFAAADTGVCVAWTVAP